MSQITYQVILSSDGKHTVIITGDNQAEMQNARAWAKSTYEALIARYGVKGANKLPIAPTEVGGEDAETPICELHHVPMVRVEGKRGPFWSCHERMSDGS